MRFECSDCRKSFSGSGLSVNINGNEEMYCANCYWKVQKEYEKKKTCEDCVYFKEEVCEKTGRRLAPAIIGFNSYFVEAENCGNLTEEANADSVDLEVPSGTIFKEVIRETKVIVKVRCSYCKNLYNETLDKCPHCGARP